METAIAYIRVSDSRQVTEGSSLTVQQDLVIRHAIAQGYKLHKVFIEEGESAKTDARPVLQRLLKYCEEQAGTVSVVIFPKIDRFARFVEDYTMLKRKLRQLGIRLDSVGEKIDDSPVGHLNEIMLAAIAQFDNEIRSERCKGGMVQAVKEGRFVWKAPAGFRNVRHDGRGTIAPDPSTGPIMKEVFERICSGRYSSAEVTAFARSRGVEISAAGLHHVVRNKAYIGVIEAFGLRVAAEPPFVAIVSRETFFGAQAVFESRERKRVSLERDNAPFPLRGTLKCPQGHILTACMSRGRSDKYAYYRCTKCKTFNRPRDAVELAFERELNALTPRASRAVEIVERVRQLYEARTRSAHANSKVLVEQIAERTELQRAIVLKNASGVIPDELARSEIDRIESEISLLRAEKGRLKQEIGELSDAVEFAISFLSKIGTFWRESSLEIQKKIQRFLFPNGLEVNESNMLRTAEYTLLEAIKTVVDGQSVNLVDLPDESANQAIRFMIELHEWFGPASSEPPGERPRSYSFKD